MMNRFTPILLGAALPVGSVAAVRTSAPSEITAAAQLPGDWYTYHGNRQRTGVAVMSALTRPPARLATLTLDAAVYASPIVAMGMTIVATENNSVYGYDRAGSRLWRTHLGTPARRSDLPCGNIDPLGITGTPVYDAPTGLVFVVAEYRSPVRHQLVALNARTPA